jgi:hypothetical protein
MIAIIVGLFFVALLIAAGIVSAADMRPEHRPPEWSVGRLIAPRK